MSPLDFLQGLSGVDLLAIIAAIIVIGGLVVDVVVGED